jgi:hypothetical protein
MLNMPWFIWFNVIAILIFWCVFWLARKFTQPPHIIVKIANRFMFVMAIVFLVLNWNPSWMQSLQPAITPLLYLFLLIVTWEVISTLLDIVGITQTDEDSPEEDLLPEQLLPGKRAQEESFQEKIVQEESSPEEQSQQEAALATLSANQQCTTQKSNFDMLTDLDDDATYSSSDTQTMPIKDPQQAEKELASSIKTIFSPQSSDSERLQQVSKLLTSDDDEDDLDDDDSKLVGWAILGLLIITLGTPFYVALKYTLL